MREEKLKGPIVRYLYSRFDDTEGFEFLAHEEPKTSKSRRPDIVFVYSPENSQILDNVIEIVEIENSLKKAIRDRKHGLNQLKKYPAHRKYLAIPHTIYRLAPDKIEMKCIERGCGLLVVEKDKAIKERIKPILNKESKSLRSYRIVLERWGKLKNSKDRFRWIRGRRIIFRE